jgi:Zn-dependent protease
LVNLVIALLLAIFILASGSDWIPEFRIDGFTQFPAIMMWINGALFLLNLIPAFPMDGGRILRSGLAFLIPHFQATLIAGLLGQLSAIAFSIYGLMSAQYLLILVGVFVFFAARFEMNQARFLEAQASLENSAGKY